MVAQGTGDLTEIIDAVGFVADFDPEHGLDQIFQGDESGDAALFIDRHGDVFALVEKTSQGDRQRAARREETDFASELG